MVEPIKLNIGCGRQVPDHWINVDYAIGARFAKLPVFRSINARLKFFNAEWSDKIHIHDIRKPLPWGDGSVDVIYSSHTLEHLSKSGGHSLLRECHRILRPNGIIRIVVPDLRDVIQEYLDGSLRADDFVEKLGVLYEPREGRMRSLLSKFVQFPHQCMYDTQTMIRVLGEIGFRAASRGAFESDIEDIGRVELQDRTVGAVVVEGRKLAGLG